MAREPFKPTAELRARVHHLAGVGVPQDDIAKIVGCTGKTLRKHFRRELDQGVAEANAMIAGYLFQAAKGGNIAAMIFWLKTRARWSERQLPAEAQAAAGPADSSDTDDKILENMMARMRQATREPDDDTST